MLSQVEMLRPPAHRICIPVLIMKARIQTDFLRYREDTYHVPESSIGGIKGVKYTSQCRVKYGILVRSAASVQYAITARLDGRAHPGQYLV